METQKMQESPGVEMLSESSKHELSHHYNTRSKSELNAGEMQSVMDIKDNTKGLREKRVLRSNYKRVCKPKGIKANRKRNLAEAARDQKSPNKPPSKSCRNTNSNTSVMDESTTVPPSKVRYSISTSSLSHSVEAGQSGESPRMEPQATHTKGDYPLFESSSEMSDISFSMLSNVSPWTVRFTLQTDDGQGWSQQKNNGLVEDETSSNWQPMLISRLTDIQVPIIPRNKVLLNYNPDGTIDLLGEGEYGYVVRGILKEGYGDIDIVAKYFKKDRSTLEDILEETRIQMYLHDTGFVPRVFGLIDTKRKDCDPIMIQECFGGGLTLDDLLDRTVAKDVWLGLCLQVATGLSRIHQKGVLINDIKLDNILVDCKSQGYSVRFIDMGIASFRSSYVSGGSEEAMADCTHLAPEVRKLKPSSPKSDIYGLGFVVKTIGEDTHIQELVTLGSKLMSEKPVQRYSLPTTINRLKGLIKSS